MAWDPVWEEVFKQQAWGKYPGEELIRFVAKNFYNASDRRKVKLLEVGCGPGANLWYMAREGFSIYGMDGSETAISQARERLDRECPGWSGNLLVGDIGKLPFDDEFFDAVVDCEAIYCNTYEQSKNIYKEMARVSKGGGRLFTRTLATGSWGGDQTGKNVGRNAWLVSEGHMLHKGYTRYTDYDEIEDMCCGFRIVEVELLTRTIEGRRHEIREWVIVGEKP